MLYIISMITIVYLIAGIWCSGVIWSYLSDEGFSGSLVSFFIGIISVLFVWPYYVFGKNSKKDGRKKQ